MVLKPWHLIIAALLLMGGGLAIFQISRSGINRIKAHEALRLKPYKDQAGKMTIGYGHLIRPGESILLNPRGINERTADALLRDDLSIAENAVNGYVTAPLTGNMYDALVSFVFNIGVNAFSSSTLLKKLNAEDYNGAANQFPRWKYAKGVVIPGLVARRQREQSLFVA